MARIDRFEELNCWKKARTLNRLIYKECENGRLSKDFDTRSQLKRASLSIMNNIAEGFARKSDKEFIRFLDFSVSSAAEVKSMIYVLNDVGYFEDPKARDFHKLVDDTRNLILGLLRYLNSKQSAMAREDSEEYSIDQ